MTVAIAYAMPAEAESLIRDSGAEPVESAAGVPIYRLPCGAYAYVGGVGKVNAAMSAQLVIDRLRPDMILNAGVVGCFEELPIGTLVLASEFVQHDVDTTAVGDPIGLVSTVNRVEFPADGAETVGKCLDALGVGYVTGRVATGDVFLKKGSRADRIRRTFRPLVCEMEGGAIAQVCLRNGVMFAAIKSVSDHLSSENNAEEYFDFGAAMETLNRTVLALARELAGLRGDC